ncbi:hypothetical protein ES703_72405 [subsurface metagenome]
MKTFLIRIVFAVAFMSVFMISGCAGVRVLPVTEKNRNDDGVRFYQPYPYLFVTRDEHGNLRYSVEWLPNLKKEFLITTKAGSGAVKTKIALEKGWNLTQFDAEVDSKTAEIGKAVPDLVGIFASLSELTKQVEGLEMLRKETALEPGIYAMVYDLNETGRVWALEQIVVFKLQVVPKAAK